MSIYDATGALINRVTYGAQSEGVSQGRYPDGTATIVTFPFATPGDPNTLSFPLAFVADATSLNLSWPAISGSTFQVQSATNLTAPIDWRGAGDVTAQNNSGAFSTSIDSSNKFFRVVRLP